MSFHSCTVPLKLFIFEGKKYIYILYILYIYSCSCYGAVQSLSGDAERDVAVEAVGQDECSLYSEDTVTDEDGRFRLRGLLVSACRLRINADLWKHRWH